jgi:HEAT repeat protein
MASMKGKKWVLAALGLPAAGLSIALLAMAPVRDRILEEWCLFRLDSGDRSVRYAAGQRLVELHSVRAIPKLVRLFTNGDSNLAPRWIPKALVHLGPAGIEAAFKVRDSSSSIHPGVFEAIGELGPDARQAIPRLIECLSPSENSDPASSVLQSIGEAAVLPLIEVLKDPSSPGRMNAALTLGSIKGGYSLSVPALIGGLQDPDALFRKVAVEALGALGPSASDAVPALAAALWDRDQDVRQSCATALEKIGPDAMPAVPDLVELLDPRSEAQSEATSALTAIDQAGEAVLPLIFEKLEARSSQEIEVVRSCFSALTSFAGRSPRADAAILSGTHDPDQDIRIDAIKALTRLDADLSRPILLDLLDDDDKQIQFKAAESLMQMKIYPDEAIPVLLHSIEDHQVAAEYLDRFGDRAAPAVPYLKDRLDDPDPYTRRSALGAALKIRPARALAIPRLLKELSSKDEEKGSREALIEKIGAIGPEAKDAAPLIIPFLAGETTYYTASEALKKIGEAAVPELLNALVQENRDIRRRAAALLGEFPGQKAINQGLIKALGDPENAVRTAAACSLARTAKDTEGVLQALETLLEDRDDNLRRTACFAFITLGGPPSRVMPVVLRFLEEPQISENWGVCSILSQMGSSARPAVPALLKLLDHRNLEIVEEVVYTLGQIGKEASPALPKLRELLLNHQGGDGALAIQGVIKAIEQ